MPDVRVQPVLGDEGLTGGSLFSGVGGLDRGLERAGVRVLWQVEIDPFRRSVLERHWPGVARFEDVSQVGRFDLAQADIIFGGFPCQDLSYAGQRRGLAGARSGLFFEMARVVGELKPRWLLIENVPGLLSQNEGQDMGIVLETLSELGYGLAWRVLDSQYFGVPQRRRRVYIVGHLGGPCPPEVLFEPEGGGGHPPQGGKAGQEVAHDLRASPRGVDEHTGTTYAPELSLARNGKRGTRLDGESETFVVRTANTLRSADGHHGHSSPRGDGGDNLVVAFSENQRAEVVLSDYTHQLSSGGGKPGQGYPAVLLGPLGGGAYGTGRNSEDDPNLVCAPVDPGGVRAAPGVPRPLDVSVLCECKDAPRYAACGDAVTVPVAEWIGRRIVACDRAR